MIRIGSQNIDTNVFLASLAGCSDLSFRLIARELGAQFCFYEMSDSNSMVRGTNRKTEDMLQTHPDDLPIAAQLLGSEPEAMLKSAEIMLAVNSKVSFLDINAACPIRKVIKKKAGAYLINEPERLYGIIKKLASALSLPVTVKIRIGYLTKDTEQIIRIAKNCERSGAGAIFVHGRTQSQGYASAVDYADIKAIKANVKIPVIASGNILSAEDAKTMLDRTGCDGVLVARGALGNPWIFGQIKSYLDNGVMLPDPGPKEKLAVLTRHLGYIEKYKLLTERTKVGFSRKVTIWYLKKFKNAAALRVKAGRAQSFKELHALIDELALTSSS